MTIRALLVDDEPYVRAGISAILGHDPQIEIVAEVGDGRAAVDQAQSHRPDVVLLDIRMPVLDGLQAARELRRTVADTSILIVTTFGEADYVAEAMHVGVDGFVVKAGDPRELSLAIHAVIDGAAFLSPQVARMVVDGKVKDAGDDARQARHQVGQLTDREREVLRHLAHGRSNAEIGARLYLTEGTVKGHVTAILRSLAVRNRVEAALIAYRANIIP